MGCIACAEFAGRLPSYDTSGERARLSRRGSCQDAGTSETAAGATVAGCAAAGATAACFGGRERRWPVTMMATEPTMIAPPATMFMLNDSRPISTPRNTAMTGLTYAYVATTSLDGL